MMLRDIFLPALLFATCGFSVDEQLCPCKIDHRTNTVDCSKKQLSRVPACVPRSVQNLLFSNNILRIIHSGQFDKFNQLVFLDLSYNSLTALDDNAFMGLSELKTLVLDRNYIKNLNNSAFLGLSKLSKLSFDHGMVQNLNENIFSSLSSLKQLHLRGNSIRYLKSGAFAGLASLKQLDLGINPLQYITSFPADVFQPLTNLVELSIDRTCYFTNCSYTYIDEPISWLRSLKILLIQSYSNQTLGKGFSFLWSLEELRMIEGNSLEVIITDKTFTNLKNTSLRKLDIGFCHLVVILPYTFSPLINLDILRIDHNKNLCGQGLLNITTGLSSTKIRSLDVSWTCQIEWSLSPIMIEELQNTELEVLDLSGSYIVFINPAVFLNLPKSLRHIYLQANRIFLIDLCFLSTLENLESLYINDQRNEDCTSLMMTTEINDTNKRFVLPDSLAYRKLGMVRSGFFSRKFKHASVSTFSPMLNTISPNSNMQNPATVILQQKIPVSNECFRLPYRLHILDLSHSCLLPSVISRVLCNSNNSLKILDISYQTDQNGIEEFWKRIGNLQHLEQLRLSGNRIKELPVEVLSKQTRLKALSLNANSLTDVKFDIQTLADLEKLDLSDNRISYLPDKFIRDTEKIAKHSNLTVILHGNKLICKCDQSNFVAWLRYTRVIFRKNNLTCEYRNGSELSFSRASEIHTLLVEECIATGIIISCVVGFVILNLALGCGAVIYHKRWKYKYLSVIGRKTINPYHPIEDREILLEYDIYISFERDHFVNHNETLHEFVTQRIYPCLKQREVKVIIREELDIGRKLYDVISYTLRRSRKVIVLLSNDYCRDHWNVFEFNMAVMEGIYTKRDVVIPVILETLNQKDVHEEVYAFLRSGPVAKFSCERDARHLINFMLESV